MRLELTWDKSQIGAFEARGLEKALFSALKKAGGDALRTTKTTSSRTIRFRKAIKAGRLSKGMPLGFPRSASEIGDLVWTLRVSGEAQPVSNFPAQQQKRGVKATINKGRPALLKSAFVATMKSGHKGVFVRKGDARLPIKELFSTRITDVFNDNGMIDAVFVQTQRKFAESFERLLPLEIAKVS